MARLPSPGGDDGTWGGVLNDFLNVAHNADGTLKTSAVSSSTPTASTTTAGVVQLTGDLGGTSTNPSVNRIRGHQVASTTPAANQILKFNGTQWEPQAETGAPDATTLTRGVIQLAGDLTGTATAPTIANGVIDNANIAASAAIEQSKIANLTTDISAKANDTEVLKITNDLSDLNNSATARTNLGLGTAATASSGDFEASGAVAAHTGDTSGAHAASAISYNNGTSGLTATDAQAALDEIAASAGSTPDATTTTKGVVQLSGDLDGTATSPTVTAAGGLKTSSTTVSTTAASAPASGQFLRANNGTTATWQAMPRMFGWYLDGVLVVGDGQGPIYRIDANVTILAFDISCKIAPVTTGATFDVETSNAPNGIFTSIFSVLPTIAAGQNIGTNGTLSTTLLSAGQYVRFNVDAVGGTAAQGVTAQLRMETR